MQMDVFFASLIDRDIINESSEILKDVNKDKLRSLKFNLRNNESIRNMVNSRKISMKELLDLPIEELASEDVKRKRDDIQRINLRNAIRPIEKLSKDEIDLLINKVEDP